MVRPVTDTADGGTAGGAADRVVLITGAASGIGAAVARACADRGWRVYATDIEAIPADVAERCRTLELDVTDAEQCEQVVESILAEAGRIDALVNNAGYAQLGALEDVAADAERRQFDVLVHGVTGLCRTVIPHMREVGSGRIVNVSSVLAHAAYPGMGTYCAGKAALEAMTDALRVELHGTGIEVALVEPAWVDTDFAATGRERLPEPRTDAYEGTYATLEDGWMLNGGPFATDPETVAQYVLTALTSPSPRARYPVGAFAHFVRWAHVLPARFRDPIQRVMGQASIAVRRVHEFLTGDR
jgi:NAD(P)-dependent dehydrogenase (short-subunit alcohol dehydrogenase family)